MLRRVGLLMSSNRLGLPRSGPASVFAVVGSLHHETRRRSYRAAGQQRSPRVTNSELDLSRYAIPASPSGLLT